MNEQMRNNQTTVNVIEKANLIWSIADIIGQGLYKPHEYGKVILPMTVIKRFDDLLKPTKDKVMEMYEKIKHLEVKDSFCKRFRVSILQYQSFYLRHLLADSEHIEANLDLSCRYSDNIQDILENFDFDKDTKLANNNMLF